MPLIWYLLQPSIREKLSKFQARKYHTELNPPAPEWVKPDPTERDIEAMKYPRLRGEG